MVCPLENQFVWGKCYLLMLSVVDVPPCSSPVVTTNTQVHTALFASVEAGGSVQLWDLNSNTEVPTAVCKPDKVNCLNKVNSWSDKAPLIRIRIVL